MPKAIVNEGRLKVYRNNGRRYYVYGRRVMDDDGQFHYTVVFDNNTHLYIGRSLTTLSDAFLELQYNLMRLASSDKNAGRVLRRFCRLFGEGLA